MPEAASSNPVLVVDDDGSIRALLRALLRKKGFQVVEAQDGAEAIARIDHGSFTMILLDLMMPNKDGFAVVRHLLEHDPDKLSCVIVMTAASERDKLDDLDRNVVFGILRKPFDLPELSQMIDSCAEGK